ncbi:hypothetical protein F7725_023323 [Dissostichus mawsoni]|uniref:Uncharacterized protein n=1 Tax=Dissostichus mawsoni TaxID=36200 RepID=A0A7J5Z4N4_DISMA|nr:hypothetical protein F7725_023323 [Dissostichus mawsoni]
MYHDCLKLRTVTTCLWGGSSEEKDSCTQDECQVQMHGQTSDAIVAPQQFVSNKFSSYDNLMAFWFLMEPSIYKMVRRQLLQPIDDFFLFLVPVGWFEGEGPGSSI